MNIWGLNELSRHSEISILQCIPNEIAVVINGWSICDIAYGEDNHYLIKTKEDAVDLAKRIIMLLELRYDNVKEKDFPNTYSNPPASGFVEGYESPNCTSEEEFKENHKKEIDSLIDEIFCCDCD